MRFVTFATTALPKPHLGLVHEHEVLDVDLAGRALQVSVPDQMLELIEHYEQYQPGIQTLLDKMGTRHLSEVRTYREAGAVQALTDVVLSAPIPHPRKNIMCLAVNYSEHAQESARARGRSAETLAYPVIFTKAPTTINAPSGKIVVDPAISSEIDWEIELGVIIGRAGKNIRAEDAMQHVFGYTVLNDVTARDIQRRHKHYFKGKSLDGFCPMGPWIVTADEIPNPHALPLRLRINGVIKQDSNTSQMIFSIPQIIATLSEGMTLEPGDTIATGTPSGVGFSRVPPEFLKPGDIMESEIEGIGQLRNLVVGIE